MRLSLGLSLACLCFLCFGAMEAHANGPPPQAPELSQDQLPPQAPPIKKTGCDCSLYGFCDCKTCDCSFCYCNGCEGKDWTQLKDGWQKHKSGWHYQASTGDWWAAGVYYPKVQPAPVQYFQPQVFQYQFQPQMMQAAFCPTGKT